MKIFVNYGKSVSTQVICFKSTNEEYIEVAHILHPMQVKCVLHVLLKECYLSFHVIVCTLLRWRCSVIKLR